MDSLIRDLPSGRTRFADGSHGGRRPWLRWALLAAAVLQTLLFAALAWHDHDRTLAEGAADIRRTASLLREHALKALEQHDLLIDQVDRRTRAMDWDAVEASSLGQELARIQAAHPEIALVGLADATGRLRAGSMPLPPGGAEVSGREYWAVQRERDAGLHVSRAFLATGATEPGFGLSRRRTTPDGRFDGTIHTMVSVGYFTRFWREISPDKDSSVALLRADGEVLSRHPGWEQGWRIPLDSAVLRSITAAPETFLRIVSPLDGVERLVAHSRLGDFPLYIAHGRAVEAVLQPWRERMLGLGLLFLATTFALSAAILMAMRQAWRAATETARRESIEAGALEAQRLETLGRLAGSVTHDFNNALQVVIGNLRLLQARLPENPALVRRVMAALQGAEMGRHLTRQLLSYARERPAGPPAPFDLNGCVRDAEPLLRQAVGSRIALRLELAEAAQGEVLGDRGGCQVALLNLAINARDAMPEGGTLTIRTAPPPPQDRPPAVEGDFLSLTVEDTGTGMTPDILAQAFEAFFTTKEPGRGTGLGLAQVWSFAQQAGGTVGIRSAPGLGTAVTLHLPRADRPLPAKPGV